MKILNVAEARSGFSALIDDIRLGGEGVVVSKYGHPVAMIVSYRPEPGVNSPSADGQSAAGTKYADWRHPFRGRPFKVAPDFDEPTDDLWSVFKEKSEDFTK